jgi:hypothetical protein
MVLTERDPIDAACASTVPDVGVTESPKIRLSVVLAKDKIDDADDELYEHPCMYYWTLNAHGCLLSFGRRSKNKGGLFAYDYLFDFVLFPWLWPALTIEQACVELAVQVWSHVETNMLSLESDYHIQFVKTIETHRKTTSFGTNRSMVHKHQPIPTMKCKRKTAALKLIAHVATTTSWTWTSQTHVNPSSLTPQLHAYP